MADALLYVSQLTDPWYDKKCPDYIDRNGRKLDAASPPQLNLAPKPGLGYLLYSRSLLSSRCEKTDTGLNDAWMEECSIWVRDGGTAGVLDAEDEIIFYGLGAQGWANDFDARQDEGVWWRNVYTDTSVYWLTAGGTFAEPPRRMESRRRGWDAADVCVGSGEMQIGKSDGRRGQTGGARTHRGTRSVGYTNPGGRSDPAARVIDRVGAVGRASLSQGAL